MKKKTVNIFISISLIIVVAIFIYPSVSNYIYTEKADKIIESYNKAVNDMSKDEIEKRMEVAHKYNNAVIYGEKYKYKIKDPYRENQKRDEFGNYSKMLEINGIIGYISIPEINVKLPVYSGGSQEIIEDGIGHIRESTLPVGGKNTHSILAGHRGTVKAKFFLELNKLKLGDKFFINNAGGKMAYEVDQIKVIEPDDFRDMQVERGQDYVTLITCTPYLTNTKRLIVRGHRTAYSEEDEIREREKGKVLSVINIFKAILIVVAVLILRRILIKI